MGRGLIQKDVLFGPQTHLVIAIGIALANAELAIPFVANDSSGIASAHDPLVAKAIADPRQCENKSSRTDSRARTI